MLRNCRIAHPDQGELQNCTPGTEAGSWQSLPRLASWFFSNETTRLSVIVNDRVLREQESLHSNRRSFVISSLGRSKLVSQLLNKPTGSGDCHMRSSKDEYE